MKKLIIFLSIFILCSPAKAKHAFLEKDYQKAWCDSNSGTTEFVLDDKTRVDCLTEDYAIEFDFAKKWAESIGQSLYYSIKTNKQPGVVLILENPEKEQAYIDRLMSVAKQYKINVWTMSQEELTEMLRF